MSSVSMREIGRRLGVSAVTVSKALSGKSGVSEEMRRQIIKTARSMGYTNPRVQPPPRLDVGVLIPERYFSNQSYYFMFYRLLVQALSDRGHFGVLELLSAQAEADLSLPNLVRSSRVQALILLGQPSAPYTRMVASQSLPVLFLDFYDEQGLADAVVCDNAGGCFQLTSRLIANGHTDIGFVGDWRATTSILDRLTGFCRAMLINGLSIRPEWIVCDRNSAGQLIDLTLPPKLPTAFVCNCDEVARRAITKLEKQGIRVPRDLSVVGFDDFSPDAQAHPTLTTFRPDISTMAQLAVNAIEERCALYEKPFCRQVIGGSLILRDSDGPAPDTST